MLYKGNAPEPHQVYYDHYTSSLRLPQKNQVFLFYSITYTQEIERKKDVTKKKNPTPTDYLRSQENQKLFTLRTFYFDQHSQWNTVLPKHALLGAIFLTPASLGARRVTGEMNILSIIFILGASRIAFGGDKAHCIAQIASGRMYISDLQCPSVVHPSGVWNQQLKKKHQNENKYDIDRFHP